MVYDLNLTGNNDSELQYQYAWPDQVTLYYLNKKF